MADEKDDRLYAPFSIEMDEHPKIIGISDAAFRALFEGTFYSRRMLTDGFLDRRVVVKRWGQDAADELASNDPDQPSWIPVEHGWQIHDFAKHHPLRAEIMAKRAEVSEKRSEAGKRGAAKRWQKDGKPMAKEWQESGNAMTSDSSESESESKSKSKTDLTSINSQSATPLLVDNFRTDSKEDSEQVNGARMLASTQKLDLDKIRELAATRCDRQLGYGESLRLGTLIVSKAKVSVRSPTSYVVRAFDEWPEIQKLIDTEVMV